MSHFGIETTQHVKFNYTPAPVLERISATLIDGLLMAIYVIMIFSIWGYVVASLEDSATQMLKYDWILYVMIMFPVTFYHLVLETTWQGRSVGKWLIGTRVVTIDGKEASFSSYFIRWIFRIIEVMMGFGVIAFFAVIINGKGQRLGDMAGKTAVIKVKARIRLEDTLYAKLDSSYTQQFSGVSELSDWDIGVIKEVLKARKDYDHSTWFVMLQKTKNKIEGKMQSGRSELPADEFLNSIIEDYNHFHRSEEEVV